MGSHDSFLEKFAMAHALEDNGNDNDESTVSKNDNNKQRTAWSNYRYV